MSIKAVVMCHGEVEEVIIFEDRNDKEEFEKAAAYGAGKYGGSFLVVCAEEVDNLDDAEQGKARTALGMDRLTIAIDFDDTFTALPGLWSEFVNSARAAGHKVICVTARRETLENSNVINEQFDQWECQMPIYFSNLGSKIALMARLGIEVHIWIDDSPRTLLHGH